MDSETSVDQTREGLFGSMSIIGKKRNPAFSGCDTSWMSFKNPAILIFGE